MVYRIFVEKKKEFGNDARALTAAAKDLLGFKKLEKIRVFNRYDAEDISKELFDYAVQTVFSEPQVDDVFEEMPKLDAAVFAVEYLPGQYDQRADSAAQCIQILSQGDRPLIKSAKVYAVFGDLSEEEIAAIKNYVINPVEAREAELALPETIRTEYEIPTEVETLEGFRTYSAEDLAAFIKDRGLAMDEDDIRFCQQYFITEQRDPTITEIRMIDTYWSDHCRHTTFLTTIDSVTFEDELIQKTYEEYLETRKDLSRTKPVCLMDIGTIAAKALKKAGKLEKLDESEEINACTVKMDIEVDGKTEPWLLLFKNETHNHPTEIEPFGGAATCIGGAIRDPLSGRSYVYGAMRVTGAADPLVPISETIPGKLPQRTIVTTAAAGYSSYGNQIGLATGIVDELYHPGYAAKRMEIGAVIAAAPAENVRREVPDPGDVVILLGGATGRDGIGGATGSSKSHDSHSVETCGAEVQKGNAPEERKLQRLFRNPEASRMIKRCNDFGAGGVSVAIGELADGLKIDLNKVPKKYEGLDGTELAISESQERMAVVVEAKDTKAFIELASKENLMATPVAEVTEEPRLVMHWNGKTIVDVSREFLNSNGAEKHIGILSEGCSSIEKEVSGSFSEEYKKLADDLNICSKRGLSERFDSTIGAGTVIMPFGGKHQLTPAQAMVQKISVEKAHTDNCSVMSWGYNPFVAEKSPYHGAYLAVVESICKLAATGCDRKEVYLSFQEYFKHPGKDGKRWSQPFCALLGAYRAQMDLGVAAIGGKDSMSGTFENIDVPPTLVSFAVTHQKTGDIVTNEFKKAGSPVYIIKPEIGEEGLPKPASLLSVMDRVCGLAREGKALSIYTPGPGGIAEAVLKMALGNGIGFEYEKDLSVQDIFGYSYGSFVIEAAGEIEDAVLIGKTAEEPAVAYGSERIALKDLSDLYENKLESVYACNIGERGIKTETFTYTEKPAQAPALKTAKPKVIIPAFPGTNCEYDTAKVFEDAGAQAEVMVIRNLSAADIRASVDDFAAAIKEAQMIFIPGGFSGGDEPDGSGKFITAFFRNAAVKEAVTELLEKRDGLMAGICNGFQALIKLGLVPYGRIIDTDVTCPTLTFNSIARHQSKIVRTRIASAKSPWLKYTEPGEIYNVPISHGEGRFIATEEQIRELAANGQIATQYVDMDGDASMDIQYNPNGSVFAVEGITSPDGRIFGKMGHSERRGSGLYKNVPGNYDMKMFEAAVEYFK
ncbi:MAG: phosphoribosylformylglycinamidine synthase [Lachnospiraceae bacterium]|nr:phosphoribosylformylglycinamidine synthase [Lachnospiraceae bacterium]